MICIRRIKLIVIFLLLLQIFALVTFVMSVVHEKYLASSNRQAKRNKKKTTVEESSRNNVYTPNDKERINIITSLINRLKTELNTIDAAIGNIHALFTFILWNFFFQRICSISLEIEISVALLFGKKNSILLAKKTKPFIFSRLSESWKAPSLPKTLTETLASLSLNPKVETLVDSTISKNHELTVNELRTILKDKLRCLNSLSKVSA